MLTPFYLDSVPESCLSIFSMGSLDGIGIGIGFQQQDLQDARLMFWTFQTNYRLGGST